MNKATQMMLRHQNASKWAQNPAKAHLQKLKIHYTRLLNIKDQAKAENLNLTISITLLKMAKEPLPKKEMKLHNLYSWEPQLRRLHPSRKTIQTKQMVRQILTSTQ